MYCVYLIKSDNLTYVGMTNDFLHRIRQHNGEIKGGAKYTSRKNNWHPILIIDGFLDKKTACQCEWKMKHLSKKK
jgi:predicted GIY-YIG superfamily endonuclease